MGAFDIKFDVSQLAFLLEEEGRNIEQFLAGATADIDAGSLFLEGGVKREVAAKKLVGATGLYKDSIRMTKATWDGQYLRGGVEVAPPADVYAPFVEYGTGPHKAEKSPMFWIRTLGPWVHLVIAPGAGTNPKTGKKQTADQAEKALAIGIGRKIERHGLKGNFIFSMVFDRDADEAMNIVTELIWERFSRSVDAGRAA